MYYPVKRNLHTTFTKFVLMQFIKAICQMLETGKFHLGKNLQILSL